MTMDAILAAGKGNHFLNTKTMSAAANSTDDTALADAVTTAEDAGDVLKEFVRLLQSKRRVIEGQAEEG